MNRHDVERCLHAGFVGVEGTRLRDEERTKVDELVALLHEIDRTRRATRRKDRFVLVDAAAGKGYVGLLAAKLVFEPHDRDVEVHLVERDATRLERAREAAERLGLGARVTMHARDVDDAAAYPVDASLVVALHACGDASDRVIDRAIDARARNLLLVPCCVGKTTRGVALARALSSRLGLPDAAPIRRRMVHAVVDGERVLRLEAAGYPTEAIEIVPTKVTPYNVLLRARRVLEPVRADRSRKALETLRESACDEHAAGESPSVAEGGDDDRSLTVGGRVRQE